MGKWTSAGFVAQTLGNYKDQLKELFIEAFGDDFVLDDYTPQGVLIQRIAELAYNIDMDGIDVVACLNPNTASGVWLDIIGALRNFTRNPGSPDIITLSATGDTSLMPFFVPANTPINIGPITFLTTNNITFSANPTTIIAYASDNTPTGVNIGNAGTTTITQITDIVVTGVTVGLEKESDFDFRQRLFAGKNAAEATIERVYQLISANSLVRSAGINYNDLSTTVDTIPPHATEWMAAPRAGIDETMFAETVGGIILNNKVPAAQTFGNATVTVNDVFGTPKAVNFTIPDEIPMRIHIQTATPQNTGVLDLSRVNDQKQEIVNFINTLPIGGDVSMSRILGFVAGDPGYDILSYQIKAVADSAWTVNSNYTIGSREYATIDLSNIAIGA